VATINGLLTWIGRGFGIHQLTLQLVLRYVFYPIYPDFVTLVEMNHGYPAMALHWQPGTTSSFAWS